MPLTADLVDALTPDIPPQELPVPQPEGPVSPRWQWSQFLLQGPFSEQVLQAAREIPGAWYAGLGLVPWAGTEIRFEVPRHVAAAAREGGYVWGGLILTSEPRRPGTLGEAVLWFEAARFPIVVRHAGHRPEASEVQEAGVLLGTLAAWAQTGPAHPCPGTQGCITAAHAVGAGTGRYDITRGPVLEGSGTVDHFAPPCLDAAFLGTALPPWKSPFLPLSPSALAFGDPAAFDGARTGPVSGHVTHVSAHARYSGSGVPMILCHDGLGNPGDSGARVDVGGRPAAMHLGRIELDGGAGDESRGVLLHQLGHVMHLDFFE